MQKQHQLEATPHHITPQVKERKLHIKADSLIFISNNHYRSFVNAPDFSQQSCDFDLRLFPQICRQHTETQHRMTMAIDPRGNECEMNVNRMSWQF